MYLAATKANAFEKVEAELFDLVEATKKSPTFSQFTRDPTVPADVRKKAIEDICAQAKFSDVTRNLLCMFLLLSVCCLLLVLIVFLLVHVLICALLQLSSNVLLFEFLMVDCMINCSL